MSKTMEKEMTREEARLVLSNVPKDRRKAALCALVGHSRIVSVFFGEVSCARCDARIGDTLMSSYPLEKCVVLGHVMAKDGKVGRCHNCVKIARTLTWRDRMLAPDPWKAMERNLREIEEEGLELVAEDLNTLDDLE